MTKPLKFRRLRVFQRYLKSLATRTITSVIYNYYNILYKLHVYNRYNYRDKAEVVIPSHFPQKIVGDNSFSVSVVMTLIEVHYIDRDYFYKKCKDGKENIIYTVKDEDRKELFIQAVVGEIYFNTQNKKQLIHGRYFKVYDQFLGTKTFDIKPVQEVKVKQLLGIDREADKVSQAEMCYYFEYCCNELRKYLNNIMLKDIEVLQ